MNVVGAFINATAIWFVLKAVEVVPFAIYDLIALAKQCRSSPGDKIKHRIDHLKHRFDWNRGKFEFIFSGTGFLHFSSCRKSKRLFLVATLVPVLIFILEILSIFLGSETRTCQTSQDPDVVMAPALLLFGEGERETSALKLNDKLMSGGGPFIRPCVQTQSTYSGIEYVVAMCSDLMATLVIRALVSIHHPDDGIRIVILKTGRGAQHFLLYVFALPPIESADNSTLVGILRISCEVFVNGKSTIASDASQDYAIDGTTTKQIMNDVRDLEKANNQTPSVFAQVPSGFSFEWADFENFISGAQNVIVAVLSQSRRVGLRSAAEMSIFNVDPGLPMVDVLCTEDYFLPRTASIVIIVTAAVLRLVLLAVPTPLSAAEYALLFSENREEFSGSTDWTEDRAEIVPA